MLVFTAYFSILEPFAGLTWGGAVGLPVWLTATWCLQHVAHAWAWALGVHILSWFLQVGAPALLFTFDMAACSILMFGVSPALKLAFEGSPCGQVGAELLLSAMMHMGSFARASDLCCASN